MARRQRQVTHKLWRAAQESNAPLTRRALEATRERLAGVLHARFWSAQPMRLIVAEAATHVAPAVPTPVSRYERMVYPARQGMGRKYRPRPKRRRALGLV